MDALRNPLPTLTANERNIGAAYLIAELLFLPALLQLVNGALSEPLSASLLNFLFYGINFIAVFLIFGRFLHKNILRTLRFPKTVLLCAVLGFCAYWLASSALTFFIQLLFPDYVNLNDQKIWEMTGSDPVFMLVCTLLLAPVTEEVFYRGLLFGSLHSRRKVLAYALSALLFAAIHVQNYIGIYPAGFLLLALVQYLPAGLLFALSYEKSGSIFTPIVIHIINNAVVLLTTR